MARKRLTDQEIEDRRETILDAAMSVFESGGGVDAISFRTVAKAAGCSYSAPYSYFQGKTDLINALRARAFRWIEQEMKAALRPNQDAFVRLNVLARAYVQAGISRPERYALMFFAMDNDPNSPPSLELQTAKRDALNVCTQAIRDGQQSGDFTADIDPLTASHMFWAAAHGMVSLEVSGQFVMGKTIDQLIAPLLQSLAAQLVNPNKDQKQTA